MTARRIQNVRGDHAWRRVEDGAPSNIFSSRSRVIFACSPAATRSSVTGIVRHARAQQREHLLGRLARRAHEVDVPEPALVLAIAFGECLPHVVARRRRAALLGRRPAARLLALRDRGRRARRCAGGGRTPHANRQARATTRARQRRGAARATCRTADARPSPAPTRCDPQQLSSNVAASCGGQRVERATPCRRDWAARSRGLRHAVQPHPRDPAVGIDVEPHVRGRPLRRRAP